MRGECILSRDRCKAFLGLAFTKGAAVLMGRACLLYRRLVLIGVTLEGTAELKEKRALILLTHNFTYYMNHAQNYRVFGLCPSSGFPRTVIFQ
jgi:hypothetical protein